jgi:integrase
MAVIEKRQKGTETTYRARVRIKGFPEASATFALLRDARRWIENTEKEIKEGLYFSDQNTREEHLVSEAIDRYMQNVLINKPKMIIWQTRQLEHWKRELGSYYMRKITAPVLITARDKLAHSKTWKGTRRAPATVNRYMAALSHLFTVAFKEWGWIEENPFLKISKLKEPRGRVRFLSDDERTKLLEACQASAN